MKLIIILHDNDDKVNFEELASISNLLKRNSVCVHFYSVKDYIFHNLSILEMLMKKEPAVFLVELRKADFLLKLIYLI